jgi:hypothetical protein
LTLDDYKILRELCLRRKTLTNFSSLAREALTQIVARFTQADPITYERAGVKMQFMSEDEFEKILRVIMDRWEGV